MRRALEARSRTLVLADRATGLYVPLVHGAAGLTFAGWLLAGAGPHAALMTTVAVLIVTCPCALGLAIPAVQVVAAGALFRDGVLLNDGAALEQFDDCLERLTGRLVGAEGARRAPTPKNRMIASARRAA